MPKRAERKAAQLTPSPARLARLRCSQQEVPPALPVQGNGRRGVHEAAGARRHNLLVQGRLQRLHSRRVCGKARLALLLAP